MTTIKQLAGVIAFATLIGNGLQAQTRNEAIEAYNQGIQLMKTDAQGAISSFEKSIQISEQVGDSAADLREKAGSVLPDLYYSQAVNEYNAKNVPGAISASKAAINSADKFRNDKTKDKATTMLSQLYMLQGINYFKNSQNDQALVAFDSSLLINPNNNKALLNKALVYRKTDNSAQFSQTIDQLLSKSENDTTTAAQAKKLAVDYYRLAGAKANTAKRTDEALNLLNTASKYGEDKDVYYQLANIYNKQKKYNEAIENAQKGLDLEKGTPEAKAKFYYELGVAQAGKGETDNACSSFKNAQYGAFLTPAKGQQTNLKCPGAAPAAAAPAKK